jgi:hypothetical protein
LSSEVDGGPLSAPVLTPFESKSRSGEWSSNSRLPTSFLPTGGSEGRRHSVQEVKEGRAAQGHPMRRNPQP